LPSDLAAGVLPAAAQPAPVGVPGWQRAGHRLRRAAWGTLTAWLLPAALLGLWAWSSRRGWLPDQVLPAPQAVGQAFMDALRSGELLDNLRISLLRVLAGFGLGAAVGLPLGLAMGLSPTLKDYLAPSFKAFAQVPVLGWLPFLMLLVGIDETLKILLVAKAALVPIVLNTMQGIENVPPRYLEVARVLRFSRWQVLCKVVLPAAFAPIWTGVRYGFTHAWLALVVVELLASSEGLGFMIVYGRQLFQLDVVLAAVLAVGVVGFVLDKLMAVVETRLTRWRRQGF
jgi:sulfonate transport system permease protein